MGEDAMLREVMQIILDEGDDSMYFSEIRENYSGKHPLKLNKLQAYDCLFEISQDEFGHMVTIIAPTKICPDHSKPSGCQLGNCWMFHICKFYILSDSCYHKSCYCGHSLNIDHNKKLLRLMCLDGPDITVDHLSILFKRLSNRTRGSVPFTCNQYNWKKSCKKGTKCNFLHICKYLLMGGCKYGTRCSRNHSVFSENVEFVLDRYGIKTYGAYNSCSDGDDSDDDDDDDDDDGDDEEPVYEEEDEGDLDDGEFDEGDNDDVDYNDDEFAYKEEGDDDEDVDEDDDEDGDDDDDEDNEIDNEDSFKIIQDLIQMYTDNNITLESLRSRDKKYPADLSDSPSRKNVVECVSKVEDGDLVHSNGCNKSTPTLEIQATSSHICINYLRGSCHFNEKCRYLHVKSTYQWQWISDTKDNSQEWENLSPETNLELEKCYCNLQEMVRFISPNTGIVYSIDLDYLEENDIRFRRITAMDLTPETSLYNQPWATKWIWYWLDNDGKWIEYIQKGNVGRSGMELQDIEVAYWQKKDMKHTFTSQIGDEDHERFIIDFDRMRQISMKNGTERKIKRRPEFTESSLIEKRQVECNRKIKAELNVPTNWSLSPNDDIYSHYQIIELNPTSEEYLSIKESIVSNSRFIKDISSVKRIENMELWTAFCAEKEIMDRKLKKDVPIKRLYHGTDSSIIEAICRQGFDCRLSGSRVGHLYGKGGYFGIECDVSSNYCDDSNLMFVVKALVGDYTLGSKDYLRPPLKDPNDASSPLYDCCVDDKDSPSLFVLFNNRQVYPEYLVKFEINYKNCCIVAHA